MNKIIIKTPLEFSKRLSRQFNAKVYLKREDLQPIRSFKIRGASNKIFKSINNTKGFVTASAGNHAQGVSYTCNKLGVEGHIFIPENTPIQKISRIETLGGKSCKLYKCGDNFDECLQVSKEFCNNHDYTFVHPFDDDDVIEGQSKVMEEIQSEIKADIVLCPVGGGGLLAGLLSKNISSDIYSVEPEGAASMYESIINKDLTELQSIDTFVDGASVKIVGEKTFNIAKKAKGFFKISNKHICHEMIELYQNEGIITEPAGALSVCGLSKLDGNLEDKNVICIISGGNNDISRYPEITEYSLRYLGLKYYFIIDFKQQPGELKKYVTNILTCDSDITRFEYIKKNNKHSGSVLLGIQVNYSDDINQIKQNMDYHGFKYIELLENDLLYSYLI